LSSNEVIGTVAMIKSSDKIYELAKMTVKKNFRGKGVANLLMDRCIEFATEQKAVQIFLISNDSLAIARNLYDKYGFKEVVLDLQKYERGNVKMILKLIPKF
jgi:putative acetyltransferase